MFCSTHLQLHRQEAKQEIKSNVALTLRESFMRTVSYACYFEAIVDIKDIKWNNFW